MSRADAEVVLYTLISFAARDLAPDDPRRDLIAVGHEVVGIFAALRTAARASLAARDLTDQMAADERLSAALAACGPIYPHNEREAEDGLCVEESSDDDC
ncbi:hypothetical protein [Stenotrophomonas sp. GD03937]|uniref:hypothetical protein n=1 Tax=Stenotrophomonas sp. GD03937 TaxID=2975408 RepID=UPI0024475D22|nr:hypothetical protein [Stenotrophomonas sp. GD03937]MDH1274566.1 hypothetical protein [Stenotrophomonas sp. GD03937]